MSREAQLPMAVSIQFRSSRVVLIAEATQLPRVSPSTRPNASSVYARSN